MTDIEHTESSTDPLVVEEFTAYESRDDGRIAIETTVTLYDGGRVVITQSSNQDTYDSISLSGAVADKLIQEVSDE